MANHVAVCPGLALVESRVQIVFHHRDASVLVCAVAGEIDLVTAPVLRRALSRAGHLPAQALVLDLSRVDFLGAIGVDMVIETARRAGPFALVVRPGVVRRILDVTGASSEFTCRTSVNDAVSACRVAATTTPRRHEILRR